MHHRRLREQQILGLHAGKVSKVYAFLGLKYVLLNLQSGKDVLLLTPLELPQGATLSDEALQGRSAGQRKATGPISVPSAPWP